MRKTNNCRMQLMCFQMMEMGQMCNQMKETVRMCYLVMCESKRRFAYEK